MIEHSPKILASEQQATSTCCALFGYCNVYSLVTVVLHSLVTVMCTLCVLSGYCCITPFGYCNVYSLVTVVLHSLVTVMCTLWLLLYYTLWLL